MKKHLKILNKTKKQEQDINHIIPQISFLSEILKKESFVEDIKLQLLSYSEIASNFMILMQFIFLFLTFPIWLLSELLSLKYNVKYFSKLYSDKFIFKEKHILEQKRIINENKENIEKYKNIIGENNFFEYLEEKEYKFTQEDFDTMVIRNEAIVFVELKLKELYSSFKEDPAKFTDYFNYYANTKKDIEENINFIARSLNEYISKNPIKEEEKIEKLHKAKIIDFNKKN